MSPSSLLYVPAELLQKGASENLAVAPMGTWRERLWAGLACGSFIGLSIALISMLH